MAPKVETVGSVLGDPQQPLKERFRALFTLKGLGGEAAIAAISQCFDDPSVLLKHELAYCLGQMKDVRAIPKLIEVLSDVNQDPMVRHEAGEALGAIGDPSVEDALQKYSQDPCVDVAETCQLALGRIQWLKTHETQASTGTEFLSIDPAPPDQETNVDKLRERLVDETLSLFDRYRAMFSLRNINTDKSARALAAGLTCPGSALFRHEIGYVLGQMGNAAVVEELAAVVRNKDESGMVRHEAAEALGSIATPEAEEVLREHLGDNVRVVRESCVVALDMSEYENSSSQFQFVDGVNQGNKTGSKAQPIPES